MGQQTKARFDEGDQVLYMGTRLRLQGWLFRVEAVVPHAGGGYLYHLHDEVWGLRLRGVREASLRGPDDA